MMQMLIKTNYSIFFVFLLYSQIDASSSIIDSLVYHVFPPENYYMCVRRLHSSGVIGCATGAGGSEGMVLLLRSSDDFRWLEARINALETIVKFVVVVDILNPELQNYLEKLLKMGKNFIAGVMINVDLKGDANDMSIMADDLFPNARNSLYKEVSNRSHTGLTFLDLPFPIVLLKNVDDINRVAECYYRNNYDKASNSTKITCPYCALNLKSFQAAAKNSSTCLGRNFHGEWRFLFDNLCDPLQGHNILSTLQPWSNTTTTSYTVIAARMDSLSITNTYNPGFTAATSFITLYTIMDLLSREQVQKPLLFALFDGEAWDYMGSKKFLNDLKGGPENRMKDEEGVEDAAPDFLKNMPVSSIDTIIELGELFYPTRSPVQLIGHFFDGNRDKTTDTYPQEESNYPKHMDQFLKDFKKAKEPSMPFTLVPILPASSLHTFLAYNQSIKHIFLSSRPYPIYGKYYHTELDIIDNYGHILDFVKYTLESAARTVARFIVNQGGTFKEKFTIDAELLDNLVYCFTKNYSCDFFSDVLSTPSENIFDTFPFINHTDVQYYTGQLKSSKVVLHERLFARLLGTKTDLANCKTRGSGEKTYKRFTSEFENHTEVCYEHHTFLEDVYQSTIFKNGTVVVDPKNKAWTESQWSVGDVTLRLYMVPCYHQEVKTVALGVVAVVLTMFFALLINRGVDDGR